MDILWVRETEDNRMNEEGVVEGGERRGEKLGNDFRRRDGMKPPKNI